jgi:hypothetical protein
MQDTNFHKNRVNAIGASEIAGLVYYYADTLLHTNLIKQETYNLIKQIDTKYISSPWSIKTQLGFTLQQKQLFSKRTSNKNTQRGHDLERPVFDKFIAISGAEEINLESKAKKVDGYNNFNPLATIDFLVSINNEPVIVEIKTKNNLLDNDGNQVKVPTINTVAEQFQVAMQMWIHNVDNAIIATQLVATRDDNHDMSADLHLLQLNKDDYCDIIQAIQYSLVLFDTNFDEEFSPIDSKRDKDLQEFLLREQLVLDLPSEAKELLENMQQLEEAYNQYKQNLDRLENILKDVAKSNDMGIIFNDCRYQVQKTIQTYYTADDIEKAKQKAVQDFEKANSLQVGTEKTKPMYKLIKK